MDGDTLGIGIATPLPMGVLAEMGQDMKYRHLSAFDAVVRCGGIRAAARDLRLTQGALTKTIRELEAEFGGPLLVRGAHGVTLTENGQMLAERARVAVAQVTAAQDTFDQLRGAHSGMLKIGLSTTIMETVLPGMLRRFFTRMPGVRLRVSEATIPNSVADLRAGRLDIAVVGLGASDFGGDLQVEPMFKVGKSIVGRPGHPRIECTSVRDLMEDMWALSDAPAHDADPMYNFFLSAGVAPPEHVIECSSLHAGVALAANSDVITAIPDVLLTPGLIGSRLSRFKVAESLPPSTYALVRRADAPLTPAAQLAVDLLRHDVVGLMEKVK